jgi:hypothetical protein
MLFDECAEMIIVEPGSKVAAAYDIIMAKANRVPVVKRSGIQASVSVEMAPFFRSLAHVH